MRIDSIHYAKEDRMKPFININDITEFEERDYGPFKSKRAGISDKIGAEKLGYSLTVLEPGFKVCPFHNHRVNEEMFFILEGEGTLRFGEERYPVKAHDIIACPPGGRDHAHQIINTGDKPLKYLSLGTKESVEVCEYPDSDKIFSMIDTDKGREFAHITKKSDEVEYFEGEDK